jgi:hypothetical protein
MDATDRDSDITLRLIGKKQGYGLNALPWKHYLDWARALPSFAPHSEQNRRP